MFSSRAWRIQWENNAAEIKAGSEGIALCEEGRQSEAQHDHFDVCALCVGAFCSTVAYFFWPAVAIWEFDMVLNSNPIAKGCWELPGCGLQWSKPERQRCYNKALKNNKNVLLEIPLMLLIALHSTHGVVKAKRDVRPSHAKQGLEPSFVAHSPLHHLPQTGKEVRSKREDLNLFQVLNLRAFLLMLTMCLS